MPHIAAVTTIRVWLLFGSELLIVRLPRVVSIRRNTVFVNVTDTQHTPVIAIPMPISP